ncbi:MAG: OmpA family protein, partial [Undibacterium sp.]|nr:OmpA family protein [Undibacterium sp.]
MFLNRIKSCGLLSLLLTVFLASSSVVAGEYDTDRAGGSDHPLISRYAGSLLYMYGDDNYGIAEIAASEKGKAVLQTVEGKISNKIYWAPKGRSPLEIFRNYQRALSAAGFETMLACETALCDKLSVQPLIGYLPRKAKWVKSDVYVDGTFNSGSQPFFHYISARKKSASGIVHVQIGLVGGDEGSSAIQGRVRQFVQIIESASIETGMVTVDAKAITDSLKRDGKIALYGILFDTGKATVKAESSATLEEMAKTLKSDASIKVFIVGHTDNQGTVESNVGLSQQRAQAVVDALSKRFGIATDRLQARGVANFSPVANNLDENGRAKNRRVEMV